ncbi:hypothetical protein RA19_07295 [Leisingera sp. ANG-M1]|nr:hypothetical protein RA19_07295 [Leisingera sp. ANG-M1]
MLGVGLAMTGAAVRNAPRGPFTPASLFSGPGALGVWCDPSQTGSLLRDSTGRMPAAAPGDPVGLALDFSGTARLQPLQQSLGAELVANGGFETGSSWTMNNGATIAGGALNLFAVNDAGKQNLAGSPGKICLVSFEAVRTSGTKLRVYLGGEIVWEQNAQTGSFSLVLQAGSATDELQFRSNGFAGTISNVSVRGILPLGSRLTGLGPELAVNGGFDSGSGWVVAGDAPPSIVSGAADFSSNSAGSAELAQSGVMVPGNWYLCSFECSQPGALQVQTGGGYTGALTVAAGMNSALVKAEGPAIGVRAGAAGQFTGAIDNFSVRQVPGRHAAQPVNDDFRPTLAQDAGSGAWYLSDDQIDDYLTVDLPDLGTDATEWWADGNGVTLAGGLTIGAGARNLPGSQKLYAYGVINRALTAAETASLTGYLNEMRGL